MSKGKRVQPLPRGDVPTDEDREQFLEMVLDRIHARIGPLPNGWKVNKPLAIGQSTYRVNVLAPVLSDVEGFKRWRVGASYAVTVDYEGEITASDPPLEKLEGVR